jgi:hypothetical protein
MDEMVSGGVQKVGEIKPCLTNAVQDGQSSRFSSKTYKKDGALKAQDSGDSAKLFCSIRIGAGSRLSVSSLAG